MSSAGEGGHEGGRLSTASVVLELSVVRLDVWRFFILINRYSYSDYLAYDGRPHLHVGCPTPKPVSAPHVWRLSGYNYGSSTFYSSKYILHLLRAKAEI